MTDIGYGFVDRRTVIIIIFVMVIAQVAFGLTIPVNVSNTGQLLTDIAILTGYFYLTRTAFRLPFAILIAIFIPLHDLASYTLLQTRLGFRKLSGKERTDSNMDHLTMLLSRFRPASVGQYMETILVLVFTPFAWGYFHWLGIVDRLGLIGFAIAATVPPLRQHMNYVGLAGLVLAIAIYVLSGGFTWLLKDALLQEEEYGELIHKVKSSARRLVK